MKVRILLISLWCLCRGTPADPRSYLITAPLSLRLDAEEEVVVQLFGFTDEVTVHVILKTSMAPNHVVLARKAVILNAGNNHQASAKVRLYTSQVSKSVSHVTLHVQSAEINKHLSVPVSRTNGYLFIQTDKPLYTPQQRVKVRVFSLNQELRPANRNVSLTFRDPISNVVDIVEMTDANNGIPSMQNDFKIPLNPMLGIWSIEASYSDFTTTAATEFEVKEYVLPSFSIQLKPEVNFISYGQFRRFNFRVSAMYLHGAPFADGEVFLRYGYVSGKNPPVVIPKYLSRERLSSEGKVDVILNMEEVLSHYDGPKDLISLMGKYLYIAVLLKEDRGGISRQAEFATVKFIKSPYTLSLVSTPPFIKPGLPFNIQVLVKDHLDKPVNRVMVRLVERQLSRLGKENEELSCPDSSISQSDGLAFFICNTPIEAVNVKLTFQTADPSLPPDSEASLTLRAAAYHSPNQRYLYIDPPLPGSGLRVGQYSNIRVYSATPTYVPVKALSYLVLSKGKVVRFGSQKFVDSGDSRQTVRFEVTPSMAPSIRLVVYYILFGEGTSELVADSVWLDIRDKCVNGLQTDLSYRERLYEPKENLQLDIRTNQVGLVALSAVDSALFTLRSDYRDPVATVLRRIEESDQGCGGGGGKDAADVFRLAGLTFITNANVRPLTGSEACTAVMRPKRYATEEEMARKAKSYGYMESCCLRGMIYIPKSLTCLQFSKQIFPKHLRCQQIFCSCCEFLQQLLEQDRNQGLILARHAVDAEFQLAPHLVRSFFPESWLWEVQPVSPGLKSITNPLPDSITTWEIKAVGVFGDGICVAAPVQVAVSLPLSLEIPLPYQLVRGEQVELKGSVYNRQPDRIRYCVTLTAGPSLCVLQSRPDARGAGLHSTSCSWDSLYAGDVGTVTFTVLGLEPGEHTLTFTLKTRDGPKDVVEKKLRVVPEGVRREQFSGGTLDPRGIYGTEKRRVELKNNLPTNMVPKTAVERMLSIRGEAFGDFLSVMHDPEGLRQLINLPVGSSVAALGGLLPLVQVYRYLETIGHWDILGEDIPKSSADVRKGIREGLIAIRSFRQGDSSYSVWMKRESSTWMTALVVKTLSMADQVVSVDRQSLSDTVAWLISSAQQPDGSFSEKSFFKPNRILAEGTEVLDQKVYLTSFTLIALNRVQKNKVPIQQLQSHVVSMRSAANYISQHAAGVKSVYVLAVATYALTLHDPNSFTASSLLGKLERLSREKGHPAVLRYWQESSVTAGWLKPDQSSGLTVETTAYVLLTVLLKGRISYANPILSWLTQDQHYGEGFHSLQETVLTLEAVTEYTRLVPNTVISQDISIRYKNKGHLAQVQLSQSRPVATPIQVTEDDTVIVSTDNGGGVSNVKMKTVYYETTTSSETCHFDLSIEATDPDSGSMRSPHLVACAKYRPPPNELQTESTLTVMKIQLPTGVEAYLEDLRQFRDTEEHLISHYELQGNTVVLLMETVPSDHFLCVGFRIRTIFNVIGVSKSLFSVFEPQDKGSLCSKQFSYETKRLQLLCVGDQCQCMTATCAAYRGKTDLSLTAAKRTEETCQPHIKYAFKVSVTSSFADGDFVTYKATIDEVLKSAGKDFESVGSGQTVELVRKVTCREVDIQNNKQYLVMGASVSKVMLGLKYRLALDSEALVELWPTTCSSPYCTDYKHQLENFALDLQLLDCPKS